MKGFPEELQDKIDITEVSFSCPGSRILIQKYKDQSKLYLKLAERLIQFFPGIESYVTRAPYITDFSFIDGKSHSLSFQITTWPHLIEFKTRIGLYKIVFRDITTVCVCLPPKKKCGFRLRMHTKEWEGVNNGGKILSYRRLVYLTNAQVLKNEFTHDEKEGNLEFIVQSEENSMITLSIQEPSSNLINGTFPTHIINQAEENWRQWFNKAPEVKDIYKEKYIYAWWVLANNLISPKGNIHYTMAVPSKKSYFGIWLWDNAMHTIALRHMDPELARNQIRGVLEHQLPDGMLPDAIFDDGIVTEIGHPFHGKVTKPPILAWAAMKIHELKPDLQFLEEIYNPLVRWNQWWFNHNGSDQDGLAQYNHPYSSGLDDHPTWDFGFPVISPDLNTYIFIQMKSLASMATNLNKNAEATIWVEKSDRIVRRMMEFLWNDTGGFFNSFHYKNALPVLTILNLFPLWTGQYPEYINKRIIEHIINPQEFGGDYLLPTVARNDVRFSPEKMWQGPVWANINYFFIEALNQVGEIELAKKLRDKTLDLIMSSAGIHEYYNTNTGKPCQSAAPVFGWTAAVFIDLAIQASNEK